MGQGLRDADQHPVFTSSTHYWVGGSLMGESMAQRGPTARFFAVVELDETCVCSPEADIRPMVSLAWDQGLSGVFARFDATVAVIRRATTSTDSCSQKRSTVHPSSVR